MLSRSAVLIALTMAVVLGCAWAAAPAIGIATTSGDFQIDRTSVSGNATILDGSLVETGQSGSELRLYEGTGMRLAGDSRGQVFRNRLVLEHGTAQVDAHKGYAIDAAGLQVQAAPHSAAQIRLAGADRVEVAARRCAVERSPAVGVADVDPFVLSVVQNSSGMMNAGGMAVIIALMSNTAAKGVYFWFLVPGERRHTAWRYALWTLLHIPFILMP